MYTKQEICFFFYRIFISELTFAKLTNTLRQVYEINTTYLNIKQNAQDNKPESHRGLYCSPKALRALRHIVQCSKTVWVVLVEGQIRDISMKLF